MISFVEMVLMGVLATFIMDIMAMRLAKMKVIHPPVGPEAVGRWILYLFRGKFVHNNINETPALKSEKSASFRGSWSPVELIDSCLVSTPMRTTK